MQRRPAGRAMGAARSGGRTAGAEPQGKIGFHGGKVEIERPRVRELGRPGAGAAELGEGGGGGLARPLGDEPDADQRLDAQVPASGAASRGRRSGAGGRGRFEVGGLAAVRGAVGCAHEGVDGRGSVAGSISWWCRSTASTSARISCWWPRSGSTARA